MAKSLKQYRLNKNYSLEKLSEISGIPVSNLIELENKKEKNPSLDIIQKIAIALNEDIVNICYAILEKD